MQPIKIFSFLVSLCVGGFFGGISLPSLVVAYVTLTAPKAWRDGQAGMLLIFPVPTGVIVGATIAASMILTLSERYTAAAWTLIAVGALFSILSLVVAISASDWRQFACPLFGWAGLWGLVFLATGIAWLFKH